LTRPGPDTEGIGFDAWKNLQLLGWVACLLEAAMKTETYEHAVMAPHVRDFLADANLADRSRNSYEETLGWVCEEFPTKTLEELASKDGVRELKTWFAELAQRRNWKHATQRQRTAAIRSFFDWAEEEKLIEDSPARRLRPPRIKDATKRRAYPPSVIDDIRNAQRGLPDKIAIQLLGDLGLRRNELRLLKLEDISIEREEIEVLHGKGGYPRTLMMTERLRDDIKKLLWQQPDHVYLLHPQGNPSNPYSDTGIHYWWLRCQKRAGVKLLLHEMRHSAASNLLATSGKPQAAQELLGHQKLSTTSTYLHAEEGTLRDAMKTRDKARKEDAA
jgi:integrase/recombinase XerC